MNRKIENVPTVIPPALDVEESELAARNEFLAEKEFTGADDFDDFGESAIERNDADLFDEADAAPEGLADERDAKSARRAKRRKSVLFLAAFGAFFGLFVVFLAWAFGFGFFAPAKSIAVDRNQKTNGANLSPITGDGDEKLKTALALVANDPANKTDAPVISDNSTNPNATSEQDLKLSSRDLTNGAANQNNLPPSGNMIVLPDETGSVKLNGTQNQIRVQQPLSQGVNSAATNLLTGDVAPTNSIFQPRSNNSKLPVSDKSDGAVGRSIFFGSVPVKNNSVSKNNGNNSGNFSSQRFNLSNEAANVPAFGTLLPVRLLGAIYTLHGSGGLVRMELSRGVKKGEFSYPAGTVLVGHLRGSSYNRAFISVVGAIDQKSGRLVKFEGEVLGVDGASGVKGERKSIKSWGTRFLQGLREAGGQAVNVLAARNGGRGGTIVLGGSGGLGGEMSSIIRGDSQENSFVAVRAGTESYVLVTDLPDEQRGDDLDDGDKLASGDKLPGVNLSESEMAEILSTEDPNKIRAALLKMSPQFRALAIKAIEEDK